jgi:alkylhydroperoxidase family enzyme
VAIIASNDFERNKKTCLEAQRSTKKATMYDCPSLVAALRCSIETKGDHMTRLGAPRVQPLPESQWDDEARELLESTLREGRVYNIFATLARHPKLLKRWLVFGTHILRKSTLPAREREIVILRAGWLCRAEYEWGHHVAIGREIGLSEEEIQRISKGPGVSGWNQFEATLLQAVDELHDNTFISDSTWKILAERYTTEQLIDLIFTVGQYHMVSMALNSLGVQLEDGFQGFQK